LHHYQHSFYYGHKKKNKHFENAFSNVGMISSFKVEDFKDIEGGHPCWECKHFIGFVEEPDDCYDKCEAFPRGIPGSIVIGLFEHTKKTSRTGK